MTTTKLFLVSPLPLVRVGLRRYQGLAGGWRCGPQKRHEATVWLEEPEEQAIGDHRRTFEPERIKPWPKLWPDHCGQGEACASYDLGSPYAFVPADPAVVLHERLGRREDTGEQVLLYSPPVGGVVHLDYLARPSTDGRSLGIMTPDGLWYVDVPGRAGEVFARQGDGAALTTMQTAGPTWPWKCVDGRLVRSGMIVTIYRPGASPHRFGGGPNAGG